MDYCGNCVVRNPKGGYCPKKGYEVEAWEEACKCFNGGGDAIEDSAGLRPASAARVVRTPKVVAEPKTKTCPKCGRTLPIAAFSRQYSAKDGRQSYCKECSAKAARKWINENDPAKGIARYSLETLIKELRRRGYVAQKV